MDDKHLKCSEPGCDERIELPSDPAPPDAEPSVYDEQRAVIARNHGWIAGRSSESGELMQYCSVHASSSIAGFAPF